MLVVSIDYFATPANGIIHFGSNLSFGNVKYLHFYPTSLFLLSFESVKK